MGKPADSAWINSGFEYLRSLLESPNYSTFSLMPEGQQFIPTPSSVGATLGPFRQDGPSKFRDRGILGPLINNMYVDPKNKNAFNPAYSYFSGFDPSGGINQQQYFSNMLLSGQLTPEQIYNDIRAKNPADIYNYYAGQVGGAIGRERPNPSFSIGDLFTPSNIIGLGLTAAGAPLWMQAANTVGGLAGGNPFGNSGGGGSVGVKLPDWLRPTAQQIYSPQNNNIPRTRTRNWGNSSNLWNSGSWGNPSGNWGNSMNIAALRGLFNKNNPMQQRRPWGR